MNQKSRLLVMVETLREQMSKVETMPMSYYDKFAAVLDKASQEDLRLVAAADVKFISSMAEVRVKK